MVCRWSVASFPGPHAAFGYTKECEGSPLFRTASDEKLGGAWE